MKRIGIYLERKPESGGAYQYCLAMLKALSQFPKNEFEITALCTYEDWKTVTEPMGIRTEVVRKNFAEKALHYAMERIVSVEFYRKYCQALHPLARKLKELSADVCIYPCGDKISFMVTTPSIITVFDLMHRYLTEFPEIVDAKIYKSRERSYRNIAKYSEMIFVDSEVGKEHMADCYGETSNLKKELENKTKVLPMIAPDYVYESVGKEYYNRPDVFEKYIFYPAQFWKHKNHKNLLLAVGALKKKGLEVNLVLCGSGKNAYEEVMRIIGEQELGGQVKILGYVTNEEMVALYQYARALVMPTYGGPTNIPQLEAFVLGCPVATSGIFGIPAQVGDAALLFHPENVDEIADCVERLWTDDTLCEELRQKGYERARMWGEEEYLELLKEYLS